MARDQEIVIQLEQRLSDWNPDPGHLRQWNPEQECENHPQHCCEYNEQGQLLVLHLCDLGWLSQIPSELWLFSSLQVLDLDMNQLSTLPAEVGNLTALQTLDLKNNPLQTPPPEMIALGLSAILAYLRTLGTAPLGGG
jgi:Leucine-rich repeat (LRR) protein